jgi:hypothetical protein
MSHRRPGLFDRLGDAVGEDTGLQIRDAGVRGQVQKRLLQVDDQGNVTRSIIPPG